VNLSGLHLPFNFHLIHAKWEAPVLAALVREYEACLPPGAWPNWVLGNHDRSRIATRVGRERARVAAMLLCTLRGTPTLYYGDELGMQDVAIPPELVRDPWERNVPGLGLGRDPERTPMQWSAEPGAGFSTGRPWLPLAADFASVNVRQAATEPGSLLQLYRALLALRRSEPALAHGDYRELHVSESAFGYERRHDQRRLGVFLNLGQHPARLPLPAEWSQARVLSSTAQRSLSSPWSAELGAQEGVIVEI